jgi:hypothetical protein
MRNRQTLNPLGSPEARPEGLNACLKTKQAISARPYAPHIHHMPYAAGLIRQSASACLLSRHTSAVNGAGEPSHLAA